MCIRDRVEEPDGAPLEAQERVASAAVDAVPAVDASMEAAMNQAFQEGGTEGMIRFLTERGVPVTGQPQ
jgi:hypothetical protein